MIITDHEPRRALDPRKQDSCVQCGRLLTAHRSVHKAPEEDCSTEHCPCYGHPKQCVCAGQGDAW